MASLNQAQLIGYLGQDPEARYLPDGTPTARLSLATTETWKDKSSGEKKERTEWHRITAFGKTAEICMQYLAKGRQVFIEGRIQTRKWDKDGQTHYSTEIIAQRMLMLGTNGRPGATEKQEDFQPPVKGEDDIPF